MLSRTFLPVILIQRFNYPLVIFIRESVIETLELKLFLKLVKKFN